MNEITHIHLGRQAFTIAVDAQRALRGYLDDISTAVGGNKEVVNEVELRMAELLAGHGVTAEKVILKEDVDYLKTQLGEPADFGGDDDENGQSKPKTNADADAAAKRLFRDTDHAMIAGVCAGLARYLNVDATIIRLIFIALIFFGGGGILLYAVLWLIVPEAKTTSDRLQMQGKPVTVDSLKRVVERADLEGAARRAGSVMSPVARAIARIILTALGVAFSLIAALLLVAVATTGFYAWVSGGITLYGQHFFPVGPKETAWLGTGLLAVTVLALFFLMGGVAMLKPKWHAPGWLSAALGGIFVLTLAAGTALGLNVVPRIRDRYEAMHHTATVQVQSFTKAELAGKNIHYVYVPDTSSRLVYRYMGKQPDVTQAVQDDTLTVAGARTTYNPCDLVCAYDNDLTVEIHAPGLQAVILTGAGSDFTNNGAFKGPDFTLTADRSASYSLRYVYPSKVVFSSNPGQNQNQLALTGLQADPPDASTIENFYGPINVSRADAVELKTDGSCDSGNALINMLSYPRTVTINDQSFTTLNDLWAKQYSDRAAVTNCVNVEPPAPI